MSVQKSLFLNLPIELRNHVYSCALRDNQPEIPPAVKGSRVVLHGSGYTERPRTFLMQQNQSQNDECILVCPLELSQVSRQLRYEFSDFLRLASVDVVAEIRNFDFDHIINFIDSLPDWRRDHFLVRRDGTAHSILHLELGGPYDVGWRVNLMIWVDFVERWSKSTGEMKTLHKTVQDLSTADRCRRAPAGEIACDTYTMYQCHKKGAGRLELDKIFYTLLGRYKAEVAMRGGTIMVSGPNSSDRVRLLKIYGF